MSKAIKFVLKSEDIMARAIEEIRLLPVTGKPYYEVIVREHKVDRSLDQNALLWSLHQAASESLGESPVVLHAYMCAQFLGTMTFEPFDLDDPIVVPNTTTHYWDPHTQKHRKLTVQEMADFITNVEAVYNQNGVPTGRAERKWETLTANQ